VYKKTGFEKEDVLPVHRQHLDPGSPEVAAFLSLSAKLGRNPALIQASGGNTSCKKDGLLWIKASGKLLADAEKEEIFVPLHLAGLRQAIAQGDQDAVSAHVVEGWRLRPSIETTLHALLPHRFVFHVHSVNVLAWAVRVDGHDRIAERLQGLRWGWVPYARPGLPLTRAVAAAARETPDILVLANHGVVVGGETCAEAERRLAEVERRVATAARPPATEPAAGLGPLATGVRFRLPADPAVHSLGLDPAMLEWARRGALYPDHVVFLGPVAPVASSAEDAALAAEAHAERLGEEPPYVLVAGQGVLVRAKTPFGANEMLRCLADVLARVPPGTPLRYLADAEVAELVDWDAEKYRKALNPQA
jgi:rhamnose utilization protein RhaD (predicted bifunctional aldolase and dehydrogenase)